MRVSRVSMRRAVLAAAALVLAPSFARADDANAPRHYVRGQQGAEKPPGVVGGFLPGAALAGVLFSEHYLKVDDDVAPPVRCWWNRVDVWNGYDHIPRRVRVCQ